MLPAAIVDDIKQKITSNKKVERGWHHAAAPYVAGRWGRGNNRLPE